MNTQARPFELPAGTPRLLLVGGALYLAWRLLAGIGSLLWTVFGLAVAFWFAGGLGIFR